MLRVLFLLGFLAFGAWAQNGREAWTDVPTVARSAGPIQGGRFLTADLATIRRILAAAPQEFNASGKPVRLALPAPDGSFVEFDIWESPIVAPALAEKYGLSTFYGTGVSNAGMSIRADLTPQGFHAQVRAGNDSFLIDPDSNMALGYVSYVRSQCLPSSLACLTEGTTAEVEPYTPGRARSAHELRTYRIAVSATGEYTAAHGGTVQSAMAAITTTINRVSAVYESELAIRFTIVAGNDDLIFVDANTDPFDNSDTEAELIANQQLIDSTIKDQNYDIGHLFGTGGGGLASGGACVSAWKAHGLSLNPASSANIFAVDLVAHEIGHQFGADHTFNASCGGNRSASTAFEPGSGSTIMAYAGVCAGNDLQAHSAPHFHAESISQILGWAQSNSCGTPTPTGNSVPSVQAGGDYTIPSHTPFKLTAIGSDPDGDHLSYSWEQMDIGDTQDLGDPDNGFSPLFRVWLPSSDPVRYFPSYSDLLAGTTAAGEQLPTTNRGLSFRVTARDSRPGGGAIAVDDMNVQVVAGPAFATVFPAPGDTVSDLKTVTWNTAGTASAPINVATVDIHLSTDGGLSFPFELASAVPNSGSATVRFPNFKTSTARLRIEAVGNIFFAITPGDFSIEVASVWGAAGVQRSASTKNQLLDAKTGSRILSFDYHYGAAASDEQAYPRWSGDVLSYGLDDRDGVAAASGLQLSEATIAPSELGYLRFSPLTIGERSWQNTDLFIWRHAPAQCVSLSDVVNWGGRAPNEFLSLAPSVESRLQLYRYFHFHDSQSDVFRELSAANRKLVVLTHGRNASAAESGFDSQEWMHLRAKLNAELNGTDWALVYYDWGIDGETDDVSAAADAAHLHGMHLASMLNSLCPDLEQVHVIAHGEGAWLGRTSLRNIFDYNPTVRGQLTLLDPAVPASGPLNTALMNGLSANYAARLARLESYYSEDSQGFSWGPLDVNRLVGKPLGFYADTLQNGPWADPLGSVDDAGQGWRNSMRRVEVAASAAADWSIDNQSVINPALPTLVAGSAAIQLQLQEPASRIQLSLNGRVLETAAEVSGISHSLDAIPLNNGPHRIVADVLPASGVSYRIELMITVTGGQDLFGSSAVPFAASQGAASPDTLDFAVDSADRLWALRGTAPAPTWQNQTIVVNGISRYYQQLQWNGPQNSLHVYSAGAWQQIPLPPAAGYLTAFAIDESQSPTRLYIGTTKGLFEGQIGENPLTVSFGPAIIGDLAGPWVTGVKLAANGSLAVLSRESSRYRFLASAPTPIVEHAGGVALRVGAAWQRTLAGSAAFTDVAVGPQNELWLSTAAGLQYYQAGSWRAATSCAWQGTIQRIEIDTSGRLWGITGQDFFSHHQGACTLNTGAGASSYSDLSIDLAQNIWLVADGRVYRYSPPTGQWLVRNTGDANVQQVWTTPTGKVWIKDEVYRSFIPEAIPTLLAPEAGAAVAAGDDALAEVLFRWSPLPHVLHYELLVNGQSFGVSAASERTERLGPGTHSWTVRAIFEGDVAGDYAESAALQVIDTRTDDDYAFVLAYKKPADQTLLDTGLVRTRTAALGIGLALRPCFVDWNGDTEPDLLIGNQSGKVEFLYGRQGNDFSARSTLRTSNGILDVGANAAPCAVDWDGDTDLDLIVGNQSGKIQFFANNAGTLAPATPVLNNSSEQFTQAYAVPVVVDWDADGKQDLLVGGSDGQIRFYRNVSLTNTPEFADFAILMLDAEPLDVGDRAAPSVRDDDSRDLVVGAKDGVARYYLNQAEALATPVFTQATSRPIASGPATHLTPMIVHWANPAEWHLISGTADGQLLIYHPFGETNGIPRFTPQEPAR